MQGIKITAEAECANCRRLITASAVLDGDTIDLTNSTFTHLDGWYECDGQTGGKVATPRIGESTSLAEHKGETIALLDSPTVLYGARVRSSWQRLQAALDIESV